MAKICLSQTHYSLLGKIIEKMDDDQPAKLYASALWMNDFLDSFKDQKQLHTRQNLWIELMEEDSGQQRCLISQQRESSSPKRQEVFNFCDGNAGNFEHEFCAMRKAFQFQQMTIIDRREVVKDEDFILLYKIFFLFEDYKINCRTLSLTHLKPTQKMFDVLQPETLISNGLAIKRFWNDVNNAHNLREVVICGEYDDDYLYGCRKIVQNAKLKFSLGARMLERDTFPHIRDIIKDCTKTSNTLEIECFLKVPADFRRALHKLPRMEEKLVYRNDQQRLAYYTRKSKNGVLCTRLTYNYTFLSLQTKFCRNGDEFQAFFESFSSCREVAARRELQKAIF